MIENGTLEKIPLVSHVCKNVKQSSISSYHARHMVYLGAIPFIYSNHTMQMKTTLLVDSSFTKKTLKIRRRFFTGYGRKDVEKWRNPILNLIHPGNPHPLPHPLTTRNPEQSKSKIKIKIHWRADAKAYPPKFIASHRSGIVMVPNTFPIAKFHTDH